VYVQWVGKKCGDPAQTKGAECLALKAKLCGTRDTSEVRQHMFRPAHYHAITPPRECNTSCGNTRHILCGAGAVTVL